MRVCARARSCASVHVCAWVCVRVRLLLSNYVVCIGMHTHTRARAHTHTHTRTHIRSRTHPFRVVCGAVILTVESNKSAMASIVEFSLTRRHAALALSNDDDNRIRRALAGSEEPPCLCPCPCPEAGSELAPACSRAVEPKSNLCGCRCTGMCAWSVVNV